jgi:hypothetical protein
MIRFLNTSNLTYFKDYIASILMKWIISFCLFQLLIVNIMNPMMILYASAQNKCVRTLSLGLKHTTKRFFLPFQMLNITKQNLLQANDVSLLVNDRYWAEFNSLFCDSRVLFIGIVLNMYICWNICRKLRETRSMSWSVAFCKQSCRYYHQSISSIY